MTSQRILFAEDDLDNREVTSLILSMAGFDVVTVPSGAEVIALAERSRFDLILLDNWLNDISGVEVCRKIRKSNPTLPIVFYSGAVRDGDKKEAMECGAQAYIVKPTQMEMLCETLHKVIAGLQTD